MGCLHQSYEPHTNPIGGLVGVHLQLIGLVQLSDQSLLFIPSGLLLTCSPIEALKLPQSLTRLHVQVGAPAGTQVCGGADHVGRALRDQRGGRPLHDRPLQGGSTPPPPLDLVII